MTDFNDRIERLAELEGKATPGEWWIDESGEICSSVPLDKNNQVDKQNIVNQSFICALRNEALPLLQEMQAEIEYLKSEAQRTDKAFSETLKDLVLTKRESKRFGNQMVLAVNKGCELQTEIERLRKGIGRAQDTLGEVISFAIDSRHSDSEYEQDMGQAIQDALSELEALHDA